MVLTFGIHKGKKLSDPDIPDRYVCWLAKPKYSGMFYKSLHVTDLKWRVPWKVMIAAREEAERRGYALKGGNMGEMKKYSPWTRLILIYAVFKIGAVVTGFAVYGFAHWMGWV